MDPGSKTAAVDTRAAVAVVATVSGCNLGPSRSRAWREVLGGKMGLSMTPWIHTRWHRLILHYYRGDQGALVSVTDWEMMGWGLQTQSPGITVTYETVIADFSKFTSSPRKWKALVGPSSPPASMHFPFPHPRLTIDVRPALGITGVPGMRNDKVLSTFLFQISDCMKLNF